MSNLQKILDSFKLKDSLNPKVWENPENPKKATMKSKVKNALEKIAEEFIDYLGDDVFVQDIILTGSLSNYNWSEFSDFDLHVIIDFEEYDENAKLYKELFDLKKFIFNTTHDIKIYGYDVELYAQDEKESHYASGVYSVMNDEWIKTPKKEKFDLDEKILKEKVLCWTDKIDKAIKTSTLEDDKEILEKVKEKLKEYRKSGLEKDGELSYENLVFKYLRRSGHIEKLFDMKNKVQDKELSVERLVKEDTEISVDEKVSNSKFLSFLKNLVDEGLRFEFTPGQKIPKDENVEKIQTALQFLGFMLPEYGIDGKFGKETENAVKEFQNKYGLPPTGVIEKNDLKYLIAALIVKNFTDSDLSNIKTSRTYKLSGKDYSTPTSFRDVVEIITNELEGGYYHPKMKQENPSKFSVMGDSGETMFGMDRKHGGQEVSSAAGQEFWKIIDANNASENWDYLYDLEDNPTLRNELLDLIVKIMQPLFNDFAGRYLSDEAREIVISDPKLFFNFVYATYNGSDWFQKFAKRFNDKVAEGENNIENLRDYALQIRKESSNSLLKRSGDKIEKIFDSIT